LALLTSWGCMATIATVPPAPAALFVPRRNRDRELVHFVGRHGVIAIEHVMAALDGGQGFAHRRVAACIERLRLLCGEPSLLRASRAGLPYAGTLPTAPSPYSLKEAFIHTSLDPAGRPGGRRLSLSLSADGAVSHSTLGRVAGVRTRWQRGRRRGWRRPSGGRSGLRSRSAGRRGRRRSGSGPRAAPAPAR
jgi:hypothetical protein